MPHKTLNVSTKVLILVHGLILVSACGARQDSTSALSVEDVFGRYCVQCHGVQGDMGLFAAANLQDSKISADSAASVIRMGRGAMPAHARLLDDDQVTGLVQYIIGMRKEVTP